MSYVDEAEDEQTTPKRSHGKNSKGKSPARQPFLEDEEGQTAAPLDDETPSGTSKGRALAISFFAMVIVGLGNKIFQVLMFIPLYNYPLFANLLTTFAQQIPKWKFCVMGVLDSIAGIMQSLGVNFLENGSLVILLMQAAIPVSMIISRLLLKTQYKTSQFVGALVVVAGLGVVLTPKFLNSSDGTGQNPVLWSFVLVLSCVPMCLSSVYKEKALNDTEIDPVYLNGWIAVFQFLAAIPLLFPSAPASNLAVKEIPQNLWDGLRCLAGRNSVMGGKHPDDCSMGPIYVPIYLVFNLGYNILIILILKYGSSNILWLAMTVMVPLGNIAFSLSFMPTFPLADEEYAVRGSLNDPGHDQEGAPYGYSQPPRGGAGSSPGRSSKGRNSSTSRSTRSTRG